MDNELKDTALTPKKKVKLLPVRIIGTVIYLAVTVFFVYLLVDIFSDKPENLSLSLAVYLVILLVYGGIAYGVDLITFAVGLIISIAKRKKANAKGSIIFFAVFTAVVAVTFAVLILTTLTVINKI